MTETVSIKIKHAGKVYPLDVDLSETGATLKMQVSSLTNVPPERQKILVKGGPLKDDAYLSGVGFKPNQVVMVLGTPLEEVLKTEDVKFVEDNSGALVNTNTLGMPSGLINLGNTCYLNSSVQVLYTIDELKKYLKEHTGTNSTPRGALVMNTKALFDKLENSNGEKVTPLNFLSSVRKAFPQFQEMSREGFYKQQDAEEAFSQILSVISSEIPNLEKYLNIPVKVEIKCLENNNEDVNVDYEVMTKLSCHINSNTNFLIDGLKNGLKETIEKQSPTLNRNAKYEITRKIEKLPKYLTVHFVRFFWKRESGKKAKIMRKVQFPFQLDVMELIDENEREKFINGREEVSKIEKENEEEYRQLKKAKMGHELTTRELYEQQLAEMNKMREKYALRFKEAFAKCGVDVEKSGENVSSLYDLTGIIAHQGASADAGHYQAFIRDEKDVSGERWYKFNDDIVSVVSREKILALAGGSEGDSALILLYKGVGM
ncbi:hypothetical protein CANINC_004983 [Pichia inconspicua]|uniref:Ubiquitin carboxyl-terminal hydrolase n=1 Tax=Pichia inconspicua TaxID=52247 RepID=A0A4V4NF50_9ASCO|nr:hypothetical protein CANINC_004983 [[Candida] inconspicua]